MAPAPQLVELCLLAEKSEVYISPQNKVCVLTINILIIAKGNNLPTHRPFLKRKCFETSDASFVVN